MKSIIIPVLLLFITGCASKNFSSQYEATGKLDMERTYSVNKKAEDMAWEEAADINVYLGGGADGISIGENDEVKIDPNKWEILGKVSASPDSGSIFLPSQFPEDENWRNYYCPPNRVLTFATIGFWFLTPFPWACVPKEKNTADAVNNRKMRIVNTLKKATKASGGDTLIITSLGNLEYTNNSGVILNSTQMMYAEGYTLKRK